MNFEHLQVGDKVFVSKRRDTNEGVVSRLTKTLVIVKLSRSNYEDKFRKIDGRELGGSTWYSSYLREYSQEKAEEIRVENTRKHSIDRFNIYNWQLATNETLAEVSAILDKQEADNDKS